jgi:hypothetical protein
MPTNTSELLTAVQYVLLEPPDGATFPSGLWTQVEVLAAASERQNRFLKASLLLVGIVNLPAALPGEHRFALPQDWLTTVGVTWFGDDGKISSLIRSDSFEADHGLSSWVNQRGTPLLYMDEESPTLQVQIAPAPISPGYLELVYIPESADLDLPGPHNILTVPDIYALPVLKYGLLAELFGKDGRGKNPEKAAYCEMRYRLGIEVAGILKNGFV